MNIKRRKRKLVKKHGKKPTICYYYYVHNVVDYAGEERVRKSFDSLKNQDAEIIVGNCGEIENIKKLTDEYGFKLVNVKKERYCAFPESKIRNKCILKSKSNFLIPANIHVEYSQNLTDYVKKWIKNNHIQNRYLKISYKFESKDGSINRKRYGFSCVFYKPYLIDAKGYDERTYYAYGSQKYGVHLLRDVFNLRVDQYNSKMVHKYQNHIKIDQMKKILSNTADYYNQDTDNLKSKRKIKVKKMIKKLKRRYNRRDRIVKNSYW